MDEPTGLSANTEGCPDFETLLQRCADKAYNFALRLSGNDADAQDIVQEAFVKFWRRNHKIDNPENIVARELFPTRALLYATVRSVTLDLISRDRGRA